MLTSMQLTEAGVFCPGAYLRMLIARGKLPASPTAGPAAAAVARLHAEILLELHPDLAAPLLREPPQPSTPGGEEMGTPGPGWNAPLLLYAHTREALLLQCRSKEKDQVMNLYGAYLQPQLTEVLILFAQDMNWQLHSPHPGLLFSPFFFWKSRKYDVWNLGSE